MQTTACCCQRREQSSEKWKKEESPCTTRLQSSACSTSPLCSSLLAMHLHFACSASLLCIYACSTSVPNTAQLAQRALLAVHLHSACSAPLISACSTSVPNSAELAMALMCLCLHCLDTCRHYITTISPNLIVTSSPTILFKWLVCFFHSVSALHTLLIP